MKTKILTTAIALLLLPHLHAEQASPLDVTSTTDTAQLSLKVRPDSGQPIQSVWIYYEQLAIRLHVIEAQP